MSEPNSSEEEKPAAKEENLALVVEVYPGLAERPVTTAFKAGEYSLDIDIRDMLNKVLNAEQVEPEEEMPLKRIREELDGGGQIMSGNNKASGSIRTYVSKETTPTGREYLYLPIKVIRPQAGGIVSSRVPYNLERIGYLLMELE